MKDIFIVMKFTIKEMIKRKSFIISTLIILAFIVIGFNVPNIIKSFKGEDGSDKLLIVDKNNVFEGTLDNLNNMNLGYEFKVTCENLDLDKIKEKIQDKEVEDAILIGSENNQIKITYIVENTAFMSNVPEECKNALTSLYTNLQISKLGLTEEQINSINPNFEFELKQVEDQEAKGNVLAIMLMSIVLFYAIYFCAYQVSSSITTEKTSKIMETLVTSTSPRNIVLRKNNRYWNSWISTTNFNDINSLNICKLIFRKRTY